MQQWKEVLSIGLKSKRWSALQGSAFAPHAMSQTSTYSNNMHILFSTQGTAATFWHLPPECFKSLKVHHVLQTIYAILVLRWRNGWGIGMTWKRSILGHLATRIPGNLADVKCTIFFPICWCTQLSRDCFLMVNVCMTFQRFHRGDSPKRTW